MMKLKIFITILIPFFMECVQADVKHLIRNFIQEHYIVIETDRPIKSGTRYLLLMLDQWDKLSPTLRSDFKSLAMQPPDRERSLKTPSGKFVLHWDESGEDAVPIEDVSGNGIPDYIDSAVVIFDHVWEIEVNQMGFQPPLNENGNPVSVYNVYFGSLTEGIYDYYGFTVPQVEIPSIPGINYTSYMEVHKDFAGFPSEGLQGLKVTAAHEFHHAIQFCYNVRDGDKFFWEMTSTWIEDFIYPEINDYYQYLPYFFSSVSYTRFDLYNFYTFFPYGNMLYVQMLEKQFGAGIVQEIWEQIRNVAAMNAINMVLSNAPYNKSWLESLSDYGLWLYYTGSRAIPGTFFEDAAQYPQVQIRSDDKINFYQMYQDDVNLSGLVNRYFEIYGANSLSLEAFIQSPGAPQGGFRQLTPSSYSPLYPINIPIVLQEIRSDTTVLILSNAERQDTFYTLDLKIAGDVDLTSVYAYPNPSNITSQGENIRFINVPPDAQLTIFNIAGKRIANIPGNDISSVRIWDLRNHIGEKVASGVYIFYVQGDGTEQSGKLSILR